MKRFLTYAALLACSAVHAGTGSLDALRAAFVRASTASYAPDRQLAERFIECSDSGRANDVLLLQLYMSVHLPAEEVRRLLGLIDEQGRWSDIDYADRTRGRWQPTLHLTRLYALAKLWADPGSESYRSQRLRDVLHAGIGLWLRIDPRCPNWWHNEIGVPKKLTAILLMLGDEATPEEIAGGLRILKRSQFGRTGQNKVWLAGNNLMKGLLTDDGELVQRARDAIAEEIRLTTGEGIQPDWSFHQHGPQIQFGNYGLAYAESISFWFRVLEGSPYAFPAEQYDIVRRLLTDGICRSVWQGTMDPSFCGRQVFIDAGRGKALSLAVTARNMAATGRPGSREFARIAKRNLRPGSREAAGSSYYWRSDCGIHRSKRWYASVRMHSERTVGFEMTNRENLLANFSADGALLTMQHGAEYENIFACWDWRRIPGTTAYDDGAPIKCSDDADEKRNRSRWVGGLAADGLLCTTMELRRDSLRAVKSNFLFEEIVVALGSGIRNDAPPRELFTTLEQNRLRGEVVAGTSGGRLSIPEERPTGRSFRPGEVQWIHHDGRGYLLLDEQEVRLSTAMQHGKWDPIDPFYRDRADSARIFKCWVEHRCDTAGSYAYAILPCRNAKQTARTAAKRPVELLRNDDACQAVKYGRTVCAVFRRPGSVGAGGLTLRVDAPAVVAIDLRTKRIAASSPCASALNVSLSDGKRRRTASLSLLDGDAMQGATVCGRLK